MQSKFANILTDPQAIGSVILVGLLDEFGTDMLTWEPETLIKEVTAVWKVHMPEVNRDKVWALVTHLTTNMFYTSLTAFIHICRSLSGCNIDFETTDFADVSEISWGISEATLIDPPDKTDTFSPEICAYIEKMLEVEAFTKPPRILQKFVKPFENDSFINDTLTADQIDYKSYWDHQQRKRIQVDEWVRGRLLELVQQIVSLPLQNADQGGLTELKQRADKALSEQSSQTQAEEESVRPLPSL